MIPKAHMIEQNNATMMVAKLERQSVVLVLAKSGVSRSIERLRIVARRQHHAAASVSTANTYDFADDAGAPDDAWMDGLIELTES